MVGEAAVPDARPPTRRDDVPPSSTETVEPMRPEVGQQASLREGTEPTTPTLPHQAKLSNVWTIEAIRSLGATVDVETAGAILGIGRSKSYKLAKAGEFPVRILRIGRRYLVPTPPILELLGLAVDNHSESSLR